MNSRRFHMKTRLAGSSRPLVHIISRANPMKTRPAGLSRTQTEVRGGVFIGISRFFIGKRRRRTPAGPVFIWTGGKIIGARLRELARALVFIGKRREIIGTRGGRAPRGREETLRDPRGTIERRAGASRVV